MRIDYIKNRPLQDREKLIQYISATFGISIGKIIKKYGKTKDSAAPNI